MINKSTKIMLILYFIFLTIIVVSISYSIKKDQSDYLGFKSGKYYAKIHVLYKDNNKFINWDIGIYKNDIKKGIVENVSNKEELNKFTHTIIDMKMNRMSLFLTTICLIFILIIFFIAKKDKRTSEKQDKSFQLFFILFIIFLIYKIVIYFTQYNNLCKEAVCYYFNIIK